jgi:3-hydroxy-3-methylglutaryl CoA synthase
MSDVTKEASDKANEATQAVDGALKAPQAKVRQVLSALKRHPLGLVVAIGAGIALVEIELAVGLIAGVGATALLVSKSGPEARQEVVAKGKAAIERARVALASRTKAQAADATPPAATATPAEQPAAPKA